MQSFSLKLIIIVSALFALGILGVQVDASTINKTPTNPNAANTIKSNLVGYWTFDNKDISGNSVTDSSGYGNTGTRFDTAVGAAPAAGIGPKAYGGKLGQGLLFNGNGNFVSSTESASLRVNTTTLSAWVRRSENSRMDSIMSKGSYALKIGPDDKPFFEMATGSEAIVGMGNFTAASTLTALAVYNGKLYVGTGETNALVYRYDGGTAWTNVDGSLGAVGGARALAVYNGKLYAGAGNGYVYRYDGGTTWTDVTVGIIGGSIDTLAVYNGKLYAGGAGGYVWRYDGGATWTDVDASIESQVHTLAVYNGKLYAGTDGPNIYIYRYDGGATWTDEEESLTGVVHSLAVYNGKLYAGSASGYVWRYDGGATWTDVDVSISGIVYTLAVYNGQLYAGAAAGRVWRYDGGATWTDVDSNKLDSFPYYNSLVVYDGKLFVSTYNSVTNDVWSLGAGKAVYANTSVSSTQWAHVAGSFDGTKMKIYVNGKLDNTTTTDVGSVVYSTNTTQLYIGSSLGSSGAGIGEENFYGIIDEARVYNKALSAKEITSLYNTTKGATVNKTPTNPNATAPIKSDLVAYWTFDQKDISGTTVTDRSPYANNGTRFDTAVGAAPAAGIGPKAYGGKLGQGLLFNGNGNFVSSTESASLRVNTTTLSAWVRRSENSRMDSIMSKGSYALKIGPDDKPFFEMATGSEALVGRGNVTAGVLTSLSVYNGQLYAGSSAGYIYRYDGGTTWTDVDTSIGGTVNVMAVYNGQLYAGTAEVGAYVRRYDGGTTWTDVDGGLGDQVYGLAVYNGQLYAGSGAGYVWRYDGGTTWTDVDSTIPSVVYNLVVYNGQFYAAGGGTNVYRYDGGTTWTDVDTSIGSTVNVMAVYNGQLYAGTAEVGAYVRRYDGGTTWTDVDSSIVDSVRSLAVYNGKLYAGCNSAGYIYRYDGGTTWTDVDTVLDSYPWQNSMVVYDGKLFIGSRAGSTNKVWSLGAGKAVHANTSVSSTQWAHVAGSFDGTKMKIYVNGKLDNTTTTDVGSVVYSTNTTQLYIGSSQGSSGAGIGEENFYGIIDEARIYNKALSAKEITSLYNTTKGATISKSPTNPNATAQRSGLVGYWTFDNKDITAVTTTDKSGYGNDGTRNGTTKPVAGRIGQGLQFLTGSYISIADAVLDTSGAHSYSVWAKPTSLPGGTGLMGDWANNGFGTMLYNQSAGNICAYVDNTNKVCMEGITTGKWHHFALVDDGTNLFAYLDGQYKGATISTTNDGGIIEIGTYGDIYTFLGVVDDARVYNRALTKAEIQQLYRMGR